MATNTEVNVRINVDAKGADNSVGSIKKQLRDATNELISMREKFGDSSAEAVNAAQKVAKLKDAIGDAKAMTDAFDPDAKFKAFGAALQGVAGGFAAVQGAQALFGAESEAVSKTLAKVQGAMALSQGINSVLQARDSFKNLGAVLQNNIIIQKALNFVMTGSFKTQQQVTQAKQADVATTITQTAATTGLTLAQNAARIAAIALRGAIMATGIGALILGVGSLISKIGSWISGEEDRKKAMDAANESMKQQQKLYEGNIELIENEGKVKKLQAEIAGKSEAEIFKIQQETTTKKIAEANRNYEATWDAYKRLYDSLPDTVSKEEQDMLDRMHEQHVQAYNQLTNLQQQYTEETLQEQKRLHELSLQADQQYSNLVQSNYLASIKDADARNKEKVRLDYENAVEETKAKEYSKIDEILIISQLELKKNLEIDAINQAAYEKQQQKNEQRAKENKAKIDARNKEIAEATKALNQKIAGLQEELLLMTIQNEDERAKKKLELQFKAGLKEIEQSKANENLKLDAILALNDKYQADLKAIEDAAAKKRQEEADTKRQKAIDYENETFKILEENRINNIKDANDKAFEQESLRFQTEIDALYQQLNTKEITEEEFRKRREALEAVHETNVTAITKTAAEERANAHAAEVQARGEVLDAYGTMVTGLVGVFKEAGVKTKGFQIASLIVEQAAAIAKIITSTQTANAAALATPQAVATSGAAAAPVILRNNIQAGISIATAIAAAAKGIAQIRGANANGSAGGGGTLPAGSGGAAPLPPQLSQTMLNQGQINQLSSATARAFVLESDVSGNQERIQRLNRAARIN